MTGAKADNTLPEPEKAEVNPLHPELPGQLPQPGGGIYATKVVKDEHDDLLKEMTRLQRNRQFSSIPLDDPFWSAQNTYQTFVANVTSEGGVEVTPREPRRGDSGRDAIPKAEVKK